MAFALRFARRVVFQSAPRRRERGINVLLLTVLGIIATLVFLGVGIAPMLNSVDSTKTAKAREIMASDIAVAVHQYLLEHGSLPPTNGGWADVKAAMPTSFPATPCDPADTTCTPTSATSDFQITTGVNSAGQLDYLIYDPIAHPTSTLRGLPAITGTPFTNDTVTCGPADCSHLYYDGLYGFQGA